MSSASSVGSRAARLLLLPGEIACGAMGLARDDKSELVRMLVNSLVWIVIGMSAALLLT